MDCRRTRMTERLRRRLVGHEIKMTGEWAEMKLLLGRPERGARRGWRGRQKRKEEQPEERHKIDNSREGPTAESAETSDRKQELNIRVYVNRQFTRVQKWRFWTSSSRTLWPLFIDKNKGTVADGHHTWAVKLTSAFLSVALALALNAGFSWPAAQKPSLQIPPSRGRTLNKDSSFLPN